MSTYFLTAHYGFFDSAEGGLVYRFASGAHPPFVCYRMNERRAELVRGKGSILGIFDENRYGDFWIPMSPGDRLFLFTDGIPETKNGEGEIIGFDAMTGFIEKAFDADLDRMLDNILVQTEIFQSAAPTEDDIVLIGYKIL